MIQFTLNRARELGYPAVVITGSPDYYSRFGFEPASKYGIFYEGMDPGEEFSFFMVKFLDGSAAGTIRGVYSDPPAISRTPAAWRSLTANFPRRSRKSGRDSWNKKYLQKDRAGHTLVHPARSYFLLFLQIRLV